MPDQMVGNDSYLIEYTKLYKGEINLAEGADYV
jgi:hypothetical protein